LFVSALDDMHEDMPRYDQRKECLTECIIGSWGVLLPALFFVIRGDEYPVRSRILTALGWLELELEEARIAMGSSDGMALHGVVKAKRCGFWSTRVFLVAGGSSPLG
jgi:hypothetical protein